MALLSLGFKINPARSDQVPTKLPNGLRIPATLKGKLSSEKSKVGDRIRLDIFEAVHGKDGKVLISAHATLTGVVTQTISFKGSWQPAELAFEVQAAEWKESKGSLDAAGFGVLAVPDFKQLHFNSGNPQNMFEVSQRLCGSGTQGEMVEGQRAVTLRHQDFVAVIDCQILYQMAAVDVPSDARQADIVMELRISNDPAVRTYFTSAKHDVELPPEFFVVRLNGMKVIR